MCRIDDLERAGWEALCDGTAGKICVGRAVRTPDAPPFVAAMASVYVREGAGWKLALYQQTPVANGDQSSRRSV